MTPDFNTHNRNNTNDPPFNNPLSTSLRDMNLPNGSKQRRKVELNSGDSHFRRRIEAAGLLSQDDLTELFVSVASTNSNGSPKYQPTDWKGRISDIIEEEIETSPVVEQKNEIFK